jgi:dienelactone hydrolase
VPLWLVSPSRAAEPLPNTKPLTEDGDLARKMVDGIHTYLDRELAAAPKEREKLWKVDTSSPEAYAKSVAPHRERLCKILGVVDQRVPPRMEDDLPLDEDGSWGVAGGGRVTPVRWAVLPGVDAEGLLIWPKGDTVLADVIVIPHADQPPEAVSSIVKGNWLAAQLAEQGCRVLVVSLIDRKDEFSANPKLNRATNQPHREFVQRMAYEMGRTLTGYEVQKVLAGADWLTRNGAKRPLGVVGYGDGGMIALYAAALDDRFAVCQVSGAFGDLDRLWEQPIDRNVWGLLKEFGDAELGMLVAPRKLIIDRCPAPKWDGPVVGKPGRGGAAPGKLGPIPAASVDQQVGRFREMTGGKFLPTVVGGQAEGVDVDAFVTALGKQKLAPKEIIHEVVGRPYPVKIIPERQKRQFDQLVAFTQKLWRDSDATRKAFWAKADPKSVETWEKTTEWYRDYFHTEVIGELPEPTMPLNPRTRQVYDEPKFTGYEVMLDVLPGVFAYGIVLLPKDLKPGERRPVVVCQHGLEGRPTDTTNPKEKTKYYNSFAAELARRGYVVYAPQNPYIGQTHFRQIQRKAQPLKLALFSFIIRQHQRTIDWLETLPNVDPKRIAFYGLSYGGKTAMRVPAVEKRYCLSICSADFNEWVGKNVSVDLDRSYMWTMEYDMYEFDLGNTFNYAEMAFLIAPRPFMVERGHDDGVGTDEMVAYEYAKIRYLYANKLKVPDRTAIEFFAGGHEIHEQDTYAFLAKHLNWKPTK